MIVDSGTRLLGLFGNPARHSLSPLIQNHFLHSYNINAVYASFEPAKDNLKAAFYGAKNLDFIGLNVTMPFKEQIYSLLDRAEDGAKITNSINTVRFNAGERTAEGFSTDGMGLIKSLEDKNFTWEGKTCFVIGAGGAAKSAVFSLFSKPLNKIYLYDIDYNRSLYLLNTMTANILRMQDKKQGLIKKHKTGQAVQPGKNKKSGKAEKIYTDKAAQILDEIDNKIIVLTYLDEIEKELDSIDLIINCTPAGMDDGTPGSAEKCPIPRIWDLGGKYIFDMVYKPVKTVFVKKAQIDGAAAIICGTDMLINQAAYSFKIWFDIMPSVKIIEEAKNIVKEIIESDK
jgi:shikimate dehydrogenase